MHLHGLPVTTLSSEKHWTRNKHGFSCAGMETDADIAADRADIASDLSRSLSTVTARCGRELDELTEAQDRLFSRLQEIQRSEYARLPAFAWAMAA